MKRTPPNTSKKGRMVYPRRKKRDSSSSLLFLKDPRPTVSAVIPARNEADNLPYVLPRIPDWIDEVLLVDGDSKDNTVAVAREVRPDIRIVRQKGRGKGAALRTGFEAAVGDIIVMLDADGSTDPAEIPMFVSALLVGADFAKGSRFVQGGGTADMEIYRKFGNWAFVTLAKLLFGGGYSDLCYGYNAFWARVLPRLQLDGDGFEIETMMNLRALYSGLKVVEVPSFEAPRIFGKSNLRTIPDGWRVLKTIFKEFARWRRRSVPVAKPQPPFVETDAGDAALQLLLRETLHFVLEGSEGMPPEVCQQALESLRATFLALTEAERSSPDAYQHNGRRILNGECGVESSSYENGTLVPSIYNRILGQDEHSPA